MAMQDAWQMIGWSRCALVQVKVQREEVDHGIDGWMQAKFLPLEVLQINNLKSCNGVILCVKVETSV